MSIEGVIFNDGVEAATQKHQADIDRLTNELRVAREALMKLQANDAFTLTRSMHPILEGLAGLLAPQIRKQIDSSLETFSDGLAERVLDRLVNSGMLTTEITNRFQEKIDELTSLDEERIREIAQGVVEDSDIDDKIESWMDNNFDIDDYSDKIEETVEESLKNMSNLTSTIKDVVRDMSFEVSVN